MTSVRGQLAVARRTATAADIPFLRSLFADAHLELTVLPTDTRFVLIDMQFRAQRRQHAAKHPGAAHEILGVNGTDVGRLLVDRSADTIHVIDVSITLGRRREGIAGDVLGEIAREGDDAGRRVDLTVWSGNVAAVALVEAAGFVADRYDAGYVTYTRVPTPDAAAASI